MNEKPESEEFDEDEEEVAFEATSEVDFDRLAKDLDAAKKRGQKLGDPAWRRLERRFEDKHTAELTSDFDDYNIDDDSTAVRKMNNGEERELKCASTFGTRSCLEHFFTDVGSRADYDPRHDAIHDTQTHRPRAWRGTLLSHGPHRRGVQGRWRRNLARVIRFPNGGSSRTPRARVRTRIPKTIFST